MSKAQAVLAAFAEQSKVCGAMGSSFMEKLCALIAENLDDTTAVGVHCLQWPGDPRSWADNLPLRLCGGFHALVLTERAPELAKAYPGPDGKIPTWPLLAETMEANEAFFKDWLQNAPQTNEVSRSGILWPAFMHIAARTQKPLRLLEIGGSGGLNLNAAHYRYSLGDLEAGQEESLLHLKPEWRGAACAVQNVEIHSQAGCDLNPLDVNDDLDRLRLRAYVWPDQADRMARLNAALTIAKDHPPKMEKADAILWMEEQLAKPAGNVCTVLFSTVAWQYFPEQAKLAGERVVAEAVANATENNPLAWLQFETDGQAPGGGIRLRLWPEGSDTLLGRADFHGRWIDWTAN